MESYRIIRMVLRPFKAQSHCADQQEHTPRKDIIILHKLKPKASIKGWHQIIVTLDDVFVMSSGE